MVCEVVALGRRQTGVVVDPSTSGLFLRTNPSYAPSTDLQLEIRRPGGELWNLDVRVARVPDPERARSMVSSKGMGLSILSAPDAYYAFLDELET